MEPFYLTISIIAIFFLILILIFFGMLMRTHSKVLPFPPVLNPCPDYWKVNENGTCSATIKSDKDKTYFNTGTLTMPLPTTGGTPFIISENTFDPQDIKWSEKGKTTLCAQRDWSLQNAILWDGVSNWNGDC